MALIICKSCGKQISSTAEKCIHCGASIKEIKDSNSDDVAKKNQVIKNELIEKKKINDLTPQLESEFLKTNKEARNFYSMMIKGLTIFSKCFNITLFFLVPFICIFLCALDTDSKIYMFLNSHQIYIKNWSVFVFAKKWVFIPFASLLFYSLIELFFIFWKKPARRKLIYHKMIQKWLLEEKNIIYTPTFSSEKVRREFENIDLDISKL